MTIHTWSLNPWFMKYIIHENLIHNECLVLYEYGLWRIYTQFESTAPPFVRGFVARRNAKTNRESTKYMYLFIKLFKQIVVWASNVCFHLLVVEAYMQQIGYFRQQVVLVVIIWLQRGHWPVTSFADWVLWKSLSSGCEVTIATRNNQW